LPTFPELGTTLFPD